VDKTHKNHSERIRALKSNADLLAPNKILKEKLHDSLAILDLSARFSKTINEDGESVYIRNEGHLTELGHSIVAEELYSLLKTHKQKFNL
jgi:hypothetical protein